MRSGTLRVSAGPRVRPRPPPPSVQTRAPYPPTPAIALEKVETLRYGENPHQKAALYGTFHEHSQQLQGKELSYNNILDITSATYLIGEFERPTVAILKHTNPCGVASAETLNEAWEQAFATDRQAPFGGIIIVNQTLNGDLAKVIAEIFTEVIVAPDATKDAIQLLAKKKNLRLLVAGGLPDALPQARQGRARM